MIKQSFNKFCQHFHINSEIFSFGVFFQTSSSHVGIFKFPFYVIAFSVLFHNGYFIIESVQFVAIEFAQTRFKKEASNKDEECALVCHGQYFVA